MGDQPTPGSGRQSGVSRRGLLLGGAAAVGVAGAGAWAVAESQRPGAPITFGGQTVPFFGPHQAGVATPPQSSATFVGLDLVPDATRAARDVLLGILKLWTADAQRLTQGSAALADTEPELALRPARLTVTVGFGPALFGRVGLDRLKPPSAHPIPAMTTDRLESRWGATDLMLQICADDPMVVAHATRVLVKNVRGLADERWRQNGFRTARSAEPDGTTVRNLMGQVDGTVNPVGGTPDFDQVVWSDGGAQPWMAGGTMMVLRRIQMHLDDWDALDRASKELVIGRRLDNGAPLTGEKENDPVDVTMMRDGIPVIPPNAHIALAHPQQPQERLLRRPYNYDEAPVAGEVSSSGLIFVTFQRDIDQQFLPIQERLAKADALNRWTTAIGSAVYVIPPGIEPGGFLGEQLFTEAAR